MSSVLIDATRPYSFMESFLYDRVIAPGVAEMMDSFLADWIPVIEKSGKALDVGCGGGQIMGQLAAIAPAAHFTGIDLSHDQIGRAKKRLQSLGARAHLQQGSALDLPFPDQSFDVVYSVASIKHWSDQLRGLQECCRVLKKGGHLFVIEVDRACTLNDTRSFISHWKIPSFIRPGGIAMFRTWVAGHSLDIIEAKALASALPLQDAKVERMTGSPAFLLSGVKS